MPEKIEQATEEPTEEPKEEAAPTKSQEKKYSDDDVNKIVAKEKASWKRNADKAITDHETIVDGLRKDITARDEIIQKNVDLLKKDFEIDEEDWELTMGDRDILQQYEYLLKKVEKAGQKDAQYPRTPKGKKKEPEFKSSFTPSV